MDISPDLVLLDIAWHSTIQQSRIDNVSILSVQMAVFLSAIYRLMNELAYRAVPF